MTALTVNGYADMIMQEIRRDMERGLVPLDVGSFSALHDYRDANMYVLRAFGEVDTYTAESETDAHYRLVNAVMDEVSRRLAELLDEQELNETGARVLVTFPDQEAAEAARITSVQLCTSHTEIDESTQRIYEVQP